MTSNQFAAILGFAFTAAWVAFGLGDAVLCLLGAVVFYALGSFFRGELDLADVQARLGQGPSGGPSAARPQGAARVR